MTVLDIRRGRSKHTSYDSLRWAFFSPAWAKPPWQFFFKCNIYIRMHTSYAHFPFNYLKLAILNKIPLHVLLLTSYAFQYTQHLLQLQSLIFPQRMHMCSIYFNMNVNDDAIPIYNFYCKKWLHFSNDTNHVFCDSL